MIPFHRCLSSVTPLLLILAVPTIDTSDAASLCKGADATSVLQCLESVYATRDTVTYGDLLAPDFQYVFGTQHTTWDRAAEMRNAARMFADPQLRSIQLIVDPGYVLKPGTDHDAWTVSHLSMRLHVDAVVDGKPVPYDTPIDPTTELWVRLVNEPEPHYVLIRWLDHTGE